MLLKEEIRIQLLCSSTKVGNLLTLGSRLGCEGDYTYGVH